MLYWYFISAVYLFILTVQDIKNKTWVDDRLNYFMFGATFALVMFKPPKHWWFMLAVFLVVAFICHIMVKKHIIGSADSNTFIWLFAGLAVLDIFSILKWLIFFIPLLIVHHIVIWILKYKEKKYPLYPLLFVSWILFLFTL
ncbi:MAG: hypothetical protein [Siphoviridae sp. ctjeG17]|nr:MAG: hypothetical protein [Siphoviridae sp. ctjeG17]